MATKKPTPKPVKPTPKKLPVKAAPKKPAPAKPAPKRPTLLAVKKPAPKPLLKKVAKVVAKPAPKPAPAKAEKTEKKRKPRYDHSYRTMRKHTVVRLEAILNAPDAAATIRKEIAKSPHLQQRGPITALEFVTYLKVFEKKNGKDWSYRRAANLPTKAAVKAVAKVPAKKLPTVTKKAPPAPAKVSAAKEDNNAKLDKVIATAKVPAKPLPAKAAPPKPQVPTKAPIPVRPAPKPPVVLRPVPRSPGPVAAKPTASAPSKP